VSYQRKAGNQFFPELLYNILYTHGMQQPKMVVRKETTKMIMIKLLIMWKKEAILATLNTMKSKNNIRNIENSICDKCNDEMFESGHMRTNDLEDNTPLQARMNTELQYQYFQLHIINNSDQ
jgi:hypothetical protein